VPILDLHSGYDLAQSACFLPVPRLIVRLGSRVRATFIDDGKTTTLTTGQTVIIPAGVAHNNTNNTHLPARMFATYVVEKGKLLNEPSQ
jgi:hypothetical protein